MSLWQLFITFAGKVRSIFVVQVDHTRRIEILESTSGGGGFNPESNVPPEVQAAVEGIDAPV